MTTNNFINKCKDSGKFNDKQIYEIRLGFRHNLTIEQVKVYVNPEFDNRQMQKIRWGLEDGLSIEEVKFYSKPELNWKQMWKIREFIKENDITDMSIDTVKFLIGLNCI